MTDYEKKYKEMKARVLEIGRGYAKGVDYSKPRQIAEYIDPELKESEDEKTRKDIVAAVETYGDFTQGRKEEIYAWLEKQCEQKPVECIKLDNEFENQISHIIASVLNGEHEYNKGFVKYASQSLLGFAKKDHKPAEWSEEDENMLTRIINEMEAIKSNSSTIFEKNIAQDKIDWLKSLKPQPHWKPSEEQPKVDLEKELISYYNEHFSPCENGILISEESCRELDCNDYESIARHFYELGLNSRKEE